MGRGFTGGYFCYFGVIFYQILGKVVNAIVACIGYKNSKSIKMELLCFRFARQNSSFSSTMFSYLESLQYIDCHRCNLLGCVMLLLILPNHANLPTLPSSPEIKFLVSNKIKSVKRVIRAYCNIGDRENLNE